MAEQVVHRSKSQKLHALVFPITLNYYNLSLFLHSQLFLEYIPSGSPRVVSVFLDSSLFSIIGEFLWSDLVFPQLENLFVDGLTGAGGSFSSVADKFLIKHITGCRLRRLAVSSYIILHLDGLSLLHHISNIEWLTLELSEESHPGIFRLFEILCAESPNLQILNISCLDNRSVQTVALPKVRMLTFGNLGVEFPFHAPNLDYLCVLWCQPFAFGSIWSS